MFTDCVGKFRTRDGVVHLASPVSQKEALLLSSPSSSGPRRALDSLLFSQDPLGELNQLRTAATAKATEGEWLAPVCNQEIWAAGVTYLRSSEARQQESKGAAVFYDKVYSAPRPELFFKATPARVVPPGGEVAIRADSNWSVPEPELALVVDPRGKIVGYTIGNDMSSRDIEGENPLYLPQAKVYGKSCAIGPWIRLGLPSKETGIRLEIQDANKAVVFSGQTTWSRMRRTPEELVGWLFKENSFPNGAILLTGTGVVPPDEYTLKGGELVTISIDGVGSLVNPVVHGIKSV